MGNPEFARYHLEKVLAAGYTIVAVISAPDRPAGRGMKLLSTPVTAYAREQGIPCIQPTNLKNTDFLAELKSYKADLQVVIAFRMLPVVVWDMPPQGTYNLHASLLPQYRGAAPINWAIINGESETGVSTFKLMHEIDTGNLLIQKKCKILPEDNAGRLHDKLMHLGADAILDTLDMLTKGLVIETPQDNSLALKHAPKLFTENTAIDWTESGEQIINLIRGLSPYPVAHSSFDGKKLLVYQANYEEITHSHILGTFISDGKKYLKVAVKNGYIHLEQLKLQGKKMMPATALLNGYDISHLHLPSE
jgi:methionyl-tRNA formyltransferase